MIERERKFLVDELPDGLGDTSTISQGYLVRDDRVEVRVRDEDGERSLTIKGGRGEERVEVELELSTEDFDELWPLTEHQRIEKRRSRVDLRDDLVAEVDQYRGQLEGLLVVEVEFESEAEADRFESPEWFGAEVTDDDRYSNATLAEQGRPRSAP